jgi:hypothetical protein
MMPSRSDERSPHGFVSEEGRRFRGGKKLGERYNDHDHDDEEIDGEETENEREDDEDENDAAMEALPSRPSGCDGADNGSPPPACRRVLRLLFTSRHPFRCKYLACGVVGVATAMTNLMLALSPEPWDLSVQSILNPTSPLDLKQHQASSLTLQGGAEANYSDLDNNTSPQQRPELKTLIGDLNSNIVGNVSWLLDFAIVGHRKCGTSYHMYWLADHPEVLMYPHEIYSMIRPAEMVSLLFDLDGYKSWPSSVGKKRGYKNPVDIMYRPALRSIQTYWPKAKLVIGVRHPVTWFESFYNFHHFKNPAERMPLPGQAYFHVHLSYLGKTNVTDPAEWQLLTTRSRLTNDGVPANKTPIFQFATAPVASVTAMSNPVFLFEVSQSTDPTEGRDAQYRIDLQKFLGLSQPLQPEDDTRGPRARHDEEGLVICDEKYHDLRLRLLEVGKDAAEWILTYLLPHPEVTVSSPGHFRELLRTWSADPCTQRHAGS